MGEHAGISCLRAIAYALLLLALILVGLYLTGRLI